MKAFSALFADLDSTNKTRAKLAFLADYFRQASKEDLVWAVALLSHRRPRRLVASSQLRSLAGEVSGIPPWLFEETYHTVGDLAETISLLVKEQEQTWDKSLADTMILLRAWSKESEEQKLENIASAWRQMTTTERLVFNKLLTGGFRMGISQKLMTRALHMALGVEEDLLALRLMGDWDPYTVDLSVLLSEGHADHAASRPYPFCLAHGLDQDPEDLGPAGDFIAEWKWDGIRAQIVRRRWNTAYLVERRGADYTAISGMGDAEHLAGAGFCTGWRDHSKRCGGDALFCRSSDAHRQKKGE
jgi:DNA ligase 1